MAFPRIARQLNYQRTLTSAVSAKLEIPGLSYEAFEQGGYQDIHKLWMSLNFGQIPSLATELATIERLKTILSPGSKIQPWSVLQLMESTYRYLTCPKQPSSALKMKSFADLHHFTEEYYFFFVGIHMKFNKYLYSEQSPKFPLSVHMELDHVGKSSKCVHGRLYHEDTKTEYVESIGTDVLVSEQTEKAVPYPDWWVEKFAPLCKNGKLLTLVLPEDKLQNPCHTSKIVSLSETDFYKHTNIASYLKFGYESIFRNIFNNSYKKINMNHFDSGVKSLTVAYTGQSRIHDELDITTWEDSTDDSTVYGKIEKKGGRPCCHMKMEFYNDKI